jgi:hypothetical protein
VDKESTIIKPRLLHDGKYRELFLHCPFCGNNPRFSISFSEWFNKEDNCIIEADEYPQGECAGFTLSVCCSTCTISMKEPRGNPGNLTAKEMLNEDFIYEELGSSFLPARWNRRVWFKGGVEIITTGSQDTAISSGR